MKLIFLFFRALFFLTKHFIKKALWNYHRYFYIFLQSKPKQQKILLVFLVALSILFAWYISFELTFVALIIAADIFFMEITRVVESLLVLLMQARIKPKVLPQTDIKEALQALGMEDNSISNIIALTSDADELVIAEWGKNHKTWSPFGKIPHLGITTHDEIEPRYNGGVQLVLIHNNLAIKKSVGRFRSFFDECFSLMHLQNMQGVLNIPTLFKINVYHRFIYRSVIDGFALTELIKQGSISITDSQIKKQLITAIQSLHQHNMVYHDLCYDNIFLCNGKDICLGDLDRSFWHPFNHDYFCLDRVHDWHSFNALFEGNIPLPENLNQVFKNLNHFFGTYNSNFILELDSLNQLFYTYTSDFSEIRAKRRILFPTGKTLGGGAFFDSSNWLWPFIADKLPKTTTTFIHLGVQTGDMAVQSLRSDVKKCVILENRTSHKACSELLLNTYQILDNQIYLIEFFNHSPINTSDWKWEKGDVVCCFGGMDSFAEQEIITALFNIPDIVSCIILEGNAINYTDILKRRNFKVEKVQKFPFSNRSFVFAYSCKFKY